MRQLMYLLLLAAIGMACVAEDGKDNGTQLAPLFLKASRGEPLSQTQIELCMGQVHSELNHMERELTEAFKASKDATTKFCLAYMMGRYRFRLAAEVLSKEIGLRNHAYDEEPPNREPLFGEYPIASALIQIGNHSIPYMIENVRSSTDEKIRELSVRVIRHVEGEEVAAFILRRAADKEESVEKKRRLLAALESLQNE